MCYLLGEIMFLDLSKLNDFDFAQFTHFPKLNDHIIEFHDMLDKYSDGSELDDKVASLCKWDQK